MKSRIPGLDGVRGIAIVLVLLFHVDMTGWFRGGAYGVTVFFVLSGFLITGILLKRPRLRDFYGRRAVRLLPPLILLFSIVALTAIPWEHIWPGMAYVASYVQTQRPLGVMGHMWSLSVEEHFYVLWPLAILTIKGRRLRVVSWLLAAAVVWRVAVLLFGTVEWAYFSTDANAFALLAGCWLAVRHDQKPLTPSRWDMAALPVLVGFSMVLFWKSPGYQWGSFVVVACTMLLIRAGLGANRLLEVKWLGWLGLTSYGIYLWHALTYYWFGPWIGMVIAIGLASGLWVWMERPILVWHRSRFPVLTEELDRPRVALGASTPP